VKIFEFTRPEWGLAFKRISNAIHDYAPNDIEWSSFEDADLQIVHVVGAGELEQLSKPKPTVIIQHCYLTASSHEIDYPSYWEKALLTVSFHNLPKYTNKSFRYLGLPWGADDGIFTLTNKQRIFKVLVTGEVAETEAIDKLYEACKELNVTMLHTGHNFGWDRKWYLNLPFLHDYAFVDLLNQTEYVLAFRLIEGFEILGVEGLFCGARPIIPNIDTYDWYRKWAITADTNQDLTSQFINILKDTPPLLTNQEYLEITSQLSWDHIISTLFTTIKQYWNK
jgi:hypothetical protein